MRTDEIVKIEIDVENRIVIQPKTAKFTLIYRTATGVHWSNKNNTLCSPTPRELTHFDWFKEITYVVEHECSCILEVTEQTLWINVPTELKIELTKFNKH